MFFTFILKFLSSAYLSTALQLNVGCLINGLPIFHPTFCAIWLFSALAIAMAWTTAYAALAAILAMVSVTFPWLVAIISHIDETALYLACLLRLPDLSLPNVSLCLPIWDLVLLTPCCVCASV